jgi:hypothetical protein
VILNCGYNAGLWPLNFPHSLFCGKAEECSGWWVRLRIKDSYKQKPSPFFHPLYDSKYYPKP